MNKFLEDRRINKKLSILGLKAEEAFIKAWKDPSLWPEWMKGVRKAKKFEDDREKTDAFILLAGGKELRIQIKLGFVKPDRQEHFFSLGIVAMQVKPSWSDLFIRHKTLVAVDEYDVFMNQKALEDRRDRRSFLEKALDDYITGSSCPA